jgi:hypothetical protein
VILFKNIGYKLLGDHVVILIKNIGYETNFGRNGFEAQNLGGYHV